MAASDVMQNHKAFLGNAGALDGDQKVMLGEAARFRIAATILAEIAKDKPVGVEFLKPKG